MRRAAEASVGAREGASVSSVGGATFRTRAPLGSFAGGSSHRAPAPWAWCSIDGPSNNALQPASGASPMGTQSSDAAGEKSAWFADSGGTAQSYNRVRRSRLSAKRYTGREEHLHSVRSSRRVQLSGTACWSGLVVQKGWGPISHPAGQWHGGGRLRTGDVLRLAARTGLASRERGGSQVWAPAGGGVAPVSWTLTPLGVVGEHDAKDSLAVSARVPGADG